MLNADFPAETANKRPSLVDILSGPAPRSPVRAARFDASPHIILTWAYLRLLKFLRQGASMSSYEGTDIVRDNMKGGEAAAERSVQVGQEALSMMADNSSQLNLKVIEIARTNMEAFFDFTQELATTKDPSALMGLWKDHTQRQFEMFSKQTQELIMLAQQLAGNSASIVPR